MSVLLQDGDVEFQPESDAEEEEESEEGKEVVRGCVIQVDCMPSWMESYTLPGLGSAH